MNGLTTTLRWKSTIALAAFALALVGSDGGAAAFASAAESSPPDASSTAEAPDETTSQEFPAESDNSRSLASLLPLITGEAVAGIVVYPQQFFNSKTVQRLPVEVVAADLENLIGIDPRTVEFAIAFLERSPSQPVSLAIIVKFSENFDWHRLPQKMLRETVFGTLDSRPYRKGKGPFNPSLFLLEDRTLILAPDQTLARMLATRDATPSDLGISQLLSHGIGKSLDIHVVANTASLQPLLALHLEQLEGQATELKSLAQSLADVERFELRARLSEQLALGAVLDTTSNAVALQIQALWQGWTREFSIDRDTSLRSDVAQLPSGLPSENLMVLPVDATHDRARQFRRYIQRTIREQLAHESVRVTENRLQWGMRGDRATQISTCAAVTMLLTPTLQTLNPILDRWQSMDGMQQLSAAIMAYVDETSHFPARASFSTNGRPLLSWRVHLLPFLGYEQLYQQFQLDEAWDGPHNRQLIRLMPDVYQNPRRPQDFRTSYTVPVGPGTMFEGAEGLPQRDLHDGPSKTLMLVEADDEHAVYWTQPADLPYDEQNPWSGLGSLHEAGFLGASADGTVRFFVRSLDPYQLRAFFSHNGGETQLH